VNVITAPVKLESGEMVLLAKLPRRSLRRPGASDHAIEIGERIRSTLRNEKVRASPIVVIEGEPNSMDDLPFYGPAEICGRLAKAHRRGQLKVLMWSPITVADG
jgi:hypothetical protein